MAESRNCPHCGAAVSQRAVECWLCCQELADGEEVHPADSASLRPQIDLDRPARRRRDPGGQFTLGSLMLVVALVAVGLGIGVAVPCLGVVFAVLSVPAWIRTAILMRNYRTTFDGSMNICDKLLTFFESFVLVALTGLMVIAGFASACVVVAVLVGLLGGFDSDAWLPIGILLGAIAGTIVVLLILVHCLREFWSTKDGTPPQYPPGRSVIRRR
jgi:hypothetical protein